MKITARMIGEAKIGIIEEVFAPKMTATFEIDFPMEPIMDRPITGLTEEDIKKAIGEAVFEQINFQPSEIVDEDSDST